MALRLSPLFLTTSASPRQALAHAHSVRSNALWLSRCCFAAQGTMGSMHGHPATRCAFLAWDGLCWLSQKRAETWSCIRRLKVRETAAIFLVERIPTTLKIGGRDLTNRVCRDEGCMPAPSSIALDAIWALLRYVTMICSPRSTPPVRKLRESGSCCRAASMAWTGETPEAPCDTILRTTRRVLMAPAAAAVCD
jgi:hypothetical protein